MEDKELKDLVKKVSKINKRESIVVNRLCSSLDFRVKLPEHYVLSMNGLAEVTGIATVNLFRHAIDYFLNWGPLSQHAVAETGILSGGHPLFEPFYKKLTSLLEPEERKGEIHTTCGQSGNHDFVFTEEIINQMHETNIDLKATIKYYLWLRINCDCELFLSPEIYYPVPFSTTLLSKSDWRNTFARKQTKPPPKKINYRGRKNRDSG